MMQTPIEIPITIINTGDEEFIQIAPGQGFGRLPVSRPLTPDLDVEPELRTWERDQTIQAAQDDLWERLEEVGSSVYTLLQTENLKSILQLQEQANNLNAWRRVLLYTDSKSSKIPMETMWSDEQFEVQPMEFVAANRSVRVSIVRHLGLEPTVPMEIESGQPLRMLVVFSNPQKKAHPLGEIIVKDDGVDFKGHLYKEKKALDDQLDTLIRLNLLEIHFLAGDERDQNNSVVYQGRVQFKEDQLLWKVEEEHACDLRDVFLELLGSEGDWHVLHYFGHGAGSIDPELVLRPGQNLACKNIGNEIVKMPRVVILNACQSANPADPDAPVPTGFATLFLMRDTVNLVCMQMKVTPETASLTTQTLYSKLSQSLFTRQMDFEEALYEIRKLVHDRNNPRLDFFCPVLYARPVNGPIFAYQDDRFGVWKMLQKEELPLDVWRAIREKELPWDEWRLIREENLPLYVWRMIREENLPLPVWRMIRKKELPLGPRKLYEVALWSSRLNKAGRGI